jgi:hypothetical protein
MFYSIYCVPTVGVENPPADIREAKAGNMKWKEFNGYISIGVTLFLMLMHRQTEDNPHLICRTHIKKILASLNGF